MISQSGDAPASPSPYLVPSTANCDVGSWCTPKVFEAGARGSKIFMSSWGFPRSDWVFSTKQGWHSSANDSGYRYHDTRHWEAVKIQELPALLTTGTPTMSESNG